MAKYFKVSLIPKYIGYNQYVNYREEIANLIEGKEQYKLPESVNVMDVVLLEKLTNLVLSRDTKGELVSPTLENSMDSKLENNLDSKLENNMDSKLENNSDVSKDIKVDIGVDIELERVMNSLSEQVDTNSLLSALNCNYGSNNEYNVINKIKEKYGYEVIENNAKCYTSVIDGIKICGRVDGFIIKDGERYLVEIKSRKNRIFKTMPAYEKVQILLYTQLCECNKVIYIQNHGDDLDLKIFEKFEDDKMLKEIIRRLKCVKKCIEGEQIKDVCYW